MDTLEDLDFADQTSRPRHPKENKRCGVHRLSKVRGAFAELRNIWKSSKIATETKLRIFKRNVLGIHLYGAEAWKVSQSIYHKIDVV